MVGTSIGSAVGFITMAHEPLARAGAFLHVSTYFADVVRTGMNTAHVWEGLRDARRARDELRQLLVAHQPISLFAADARQHAENADGHRGATI